MEVKEFKSYLKITDQEFIQAIANDNNIKYIKGGLGETLLHWWAIEYNQGKVGLLFKLGSDVNTKNMFDQTPLMEAVYIKSNDMAKYLIELGADIEYINKNGDSTISIAAGSGNIEMVKILMPLLKNNIQLYFSDVTSNLICSNEGEMKEYLNGLGIVDPWLME